MLAQKSLGVEADGVFASMKAVHFTLNGATSTWYGFWFGFGLTVSVFLLFSAILGWQLDKVPLASWHAVSTIAWAFFAAYVCTALLSWMYFFAGPGVIGTLVALLLAAGAWQKQRAAAGEREFQTKKERQTISG